MTGDRIKVVLADDAADVRFLIGTKLRYSGLFEIVGEAANGAEAVQLTVDLQPDVVLLDVSMPEMDGIDALQLIVARSPETSVVMFTGFDERGLADRARALGAADFLEKSASIERLTEVLLAVRGDRRDRSAVVAALPLPDPVLVEHLERFGAVFDEAAIGMASLTLTGRVVRANAQLEHLATGVVDGPLVGTRFEQLISDPGRSAMLSVLAEVAAGRRDADSSDHHLGDRAVISTVAVVRDSRGAPLYMFLQVQDVTERHAGAELLRQSEERFRLLVESVGDYAIFMLDPGGHVASWNLGAERAKGYRAEEILGRHFSTFYEPEAVAAGHPQHELEIAVAEGRYEEEGWRIRKDGTRFWASVVITALWDAQRVLVGFAKVTRDMTERKELLASLEAAVQQRTEFLAVTAHELRTPVSLIHGFADALDSRWGELPDGERRDMVSALARSGARLSRLVEDLLTAARLEAGAVEIVPQAFRLDELIAETVADHDASVVVDVTPVTVTADRGRVQQMLSNYLSNATRYGRPPVTVTMRTVGPDVEVTVADRGEGVEERAIPDLFTRFAPGRAPDGTGLGLFIVKELARAQGGEAWYEPGPGDGAAFSFRVPLAPDDAPPT